jgi:hypothetical protein
MTETPRQGLVIAVFYGLIALIILINPLFHLDGYVPGAPTTDYYHFHWNYWWIRHALTNGLNVYETSYVMAPYTSSLAYHTLTPFWYPVWALLEPAFGTVAAMTGIQFCILTLTGWTAFLLLRREGVPRSLALLGGAVFQLLPIMLNSLFWTTLNIMSWFWLPTLLLLWGRTARAKNPFIHAAIFGLALWGMLLTDIQYPLLIAPILIPYGIKTVIESQHKARLIAAGLGAVMLALALTWAVGLLPAILGYDRAGLAPTPADRAVEIPFPLGYITRTLFLESVGSLIIPLLIAALALARWTPRRSWFWALLIPLPLILSAGAITPVYTLLHEALGGMFRYPERFVPVFALPALIVIGLTFARWRWMRSPAFAGAALLVIAAEARILHPFPLQALPPRYTFYDQIAAEPYDYVIVDVPTAGMSGEGIVGETIFPSTQFYGLTHGKRMVNGHISRVNTYTYMYMRTDDAMMAWLGQRRFLEAETVRAQMRERIFSFPIGYFVIHRQWIEPYGTTQGEVIGFFNQQRDLVCPVWVEGDALVYRTAWHPDGCPPRTPPELTIDIGGTDDVRYLGWGWHPAEPVGGTRWRWTGQPLFGQTDARLYLDLPSADYTMTLSAQSFRESRTLQVRVNETVLEETAQVQPDGLAEYVFMLPAAAIPDDGRVEIALIYDAAPSPAELGVSEDQRPLAVALDWVRLTPSDAPGSQ